jgi:hypothetical protein
VLTGFSITQFAAIIHACQIHVAVTVSVSPTMAPADVIQGGLATTVRALLL